MAERWDTLWTNLRLATMVAGGAPYGAIEDGAIAVRDGRIAWVGPRAELPAREARTTHDCAGRWATPGLVDCHTHLVYGGQRADEFEMRLEGATYESIAKAGGGYALADAGSLNGTYVNRRRVDAADLHHGDELQIGRYRLTFVLGGAKEN